MVLDPSDPNHGHPGRIGLYRGERLVGWRFFGSLDAQRFPHVLVAAAVDLVRRNPSEGGLLVQCFPYRATPVLRHLAFLIAQMLQSSEIFVESSSGIPLDGWPVGPHETELEPAFPPMVQSAQRKAHWIALLAEGEDHEVDLAEVSIEGSRLGSGEWLRDAFVQRDLGEALRVERAGSTLFVVAEGDIAEEKIARALDHYHCSKAVFAEPGWYSNLLCSFVRQDGEDFGYGIVKQIDFARGTVHARCTAVAPAPVRILRLGALRVDAEGRELGELKPWQV